MPRWSKYTGDLKFMNQLIEYNRRITQLTDYKLLLRDNISIVEFIFSLILSLFCKKIIFV